MKTVVLFVRMHAADRKKSNGKNAIFTRSLRKIAFIDNREFNYQAPDYPKEGELWLVDVVRENPSATGGCLILHPESRLDRDDVSPLVHGMYDMERHDDAVILKPHSEGLWVMSPAAKRAIQEAFGPEVKTVVIDHGGGIWNRRKPVETVVADEAAQLLKAIES